jgi:hypothetical protein
MSGMVLGSIPMDDHTLQRDVEAVGCGAVSAASVGRLWRQPFGLGDGTAIRGGPDH